MDKCFLKGELIFVICPSIEEVRQVVKRRMRGPRKGETDSVYRDKKASRSGMGRETKAY